MGGHLKLTLHIAIVALVVIWIANNVSFVGGVVGQR